jgi:hypothetical protein
MKHKNEMIFEFFVRKKLRKLLTNKKKKKMGRV